MCGEGGFHGPLGGTHNSRGRSQTSGLELPCSRLLPAPPPPQENENGGDSQSNSVSESPSSPGLLAVSPDSGETHSEVRLGMLGGGSGWKSGVWAEPPLWGCPGGAQWG